MWDSQREYEEWYGDPSAYAVEEQVANGQRPMSQRHQDMRDAARARLWLYQTLILPPARMLDIGAGTGAFVEEARHCGYSAYGIDPRPIGVVERGYWQDVDGSWDILCCHDLFEHLCDPRGFLNHMGQHLVEDGLLIIEQPEWGSPHQRKCGFEWRHIRPRQHLCLWSRKSAEVVYNEEGFEVIMFSRPLKASLGKMTHILQKRR